MYRDFKDVLIELRTKNQMTQNELAIRLGVVKSTIANYESGYRNPDNETLIKLSSIFSVSIDYLLGLEIDTKPLSYNGSTDKTISVDEFTYALCNETKDLTEEQKNLLLSIAKGFKGNK